MAVQRRRMKQAETLEGRELQLMSLASDLAEKQLEDGTASSQIITHFLKAASSREQLEKEKLRRENLLLAAKVDALASATRMEELYESAIAAMGIYNPSAHDDDFDDDY